MSSFSKLTLRDFPEVFAQTTDSKQNDEKNTNSKSQT